MDLEMLRGKLLTKDDVKSLLGLTEDSKVILCNYTNASSNKETNRFYATATVHRRTPQQLRLNWENLKKNVRKRCTKIRMNRIQSGVGIPEYVPPRDVLDRVADLLGSTASGLIVHLVGTKSHFFVNDNDGDGSGDGAQVPIPGAIAACRIASAICMAICAAVVLVV